MNLTDISIFGNQVCCSKIYVIILYGMQREACFAQLNSPVIHLEILSAVFFQYAERKPQRTMLSCVLPAELNALSFSFPSTHRLLCFFGQSMPHCSLPNAFESPASFQPLKPLAFPTHPCSRGTRFDASGGYNLGGN